MVWDFAFSPLTFDSNFELISRNTKSTRQKAHFFSRRGLTPPKNKGPVTGRHRAFVLMRTRDQA
jgi:hypothetical protein